MDTARRRPLDLLERPKGCLGLSSLWTSGRSRFGTDSRGDEGQVAAASAGRLRAASRATTPGLRARPWATASTPVTTSALSAVSWSLAGPGSLAPAVAESGPPRPGASALHPGALRSETEAGPRLGGWPNRLRRLVATGFCAPHRPVGCRRTDASRVGDRRRRDGTGVV